MSTRIYLARHGEATYETELTTDDGGWLTATGRDQARGLGSRLGSAGVAAVWSSPLSRAVQTAELAAARLGVADVVVREGLREYGVGSLAGTTASESTELFPIYQQWVRGDESARIPGGDLIGDWVGRVVGALEEVAAVCAGRTALVVSHGGAILAGVPALCGLPRTGEVGHSIANCAYLVLEHDGGWTLLPDELVG